jgi:hypothetical protein
LCYLSLDTLKAAPYNLVKDEGVYAKIISVNAYGESVQSAAGNGALIQLVPDAPISLANDPSTTSDTTIRFTWIPGPSDGTSAVIDHDIYYDNAIGDGNYILLESGIVNLYYQTTVALNTG